MEIPRDSESIRKMINRRIFLLFISPVFLFSSQLETLNLANELEIYKKTEFKALLHYNQKLNIEDKKFINSDDFSLKNELNATIHGFYEPQKNYKNINNHPQCKFPARLLFITHELNISKDEFAKVSCKDLDEYKAKAPADTISLIYASENVKNPASMMGHTFLKYSGQNYHNKKVEHAISFYTMIDTINLITLAYQNIFSGMQGLFALQPYQKIIAQYIDKENRNVWEYKLKLSEYRRKLIYYHVWELRDKEIKYFFTSYNCSTVIYYTLSLANPEIYEEKRLWITPLDTVKFLYKYDLIQKSELIPSSEWLVKMLQENVDSKDVTIIKNIIKKEKYEEIDFLAYYPSKLLGAYATLEYKNGEIDEERYTKIQSKILKDKNSIDISKYKSPNKIPPERQFGVGYFKINSEDYIKLSFLPASHLINDYNREYFGESELKIGYLSVLANNKKIELDEFTLYGMKLYLPYDSLTNDLSYQFEIALKKEYSKEMKYTDTFKIDGGVGVDFNIAKDINIFVLLNGGVAYNKYDKTHMFFNPQIGGMIYEVFNMKSLLYYQPLFVGSSKVYDKYVLNHNIFFDNKYNFYFDVVQVIDEQKFINCEFGLNVLF